MIMIFLFLVPSVPATIGNFLIPIMIGAKDLAFPKDEPAELVSVCDSRDFFIAGERWCWAAWIRAGPSPLRCQRII